jgi:hypothetical protein
VVEESIMVGFDDIHGRPDPEPPDCEECVRLDTEIESLRGLLKKYIRHVVEMEGTDFIRNYQKVFYGCADAEWETLEQLAKEVKEEDE